MSHPNSLGDFDVVTGPAAPVRPIAPATPSSAPDSPSAAHNPGDHSTPANGQAEPSPS
jgi:hypothetical protein